MQTIHVFGFPSYVGGADTELWHTLRLWRAAGWPVTLVPTWGNPTRRWVEAVESIGCAVARCDGPQDLHRIDTLPGSIAVSFCNHHYFSAWKWLRAHEVTILWSNCMCWQGGAERSAVDQFGPADGYHFQSGFQQGRLADLVHLHRPRPPAWSIIPGAMALPKPWPHIRRRHDREDPFWIGRLARNDPDKWSSNHWAVCGKVPHPHRRAIVMGHNEIIRDKIGPTPPWAEALPLNCIPAEQFYRRTHVILGLNGGAMENWPRIGLEAITEGVAVVAQRQWGWIEQLESLDLGHWLTDSDEEMAYRLAEMAWNDAWRVERIQAAREKLARMVAPDALLPAWRDLFAAATRRRAERKEREVADVH